MKTRATGWFEISREGLAQLQGPRPKSNIIRELVQNGFDESITICEVTLCKHGRDVYITVKDDSPEGFKNLDHAFTMYAHTYKRDDIHKRGRYNLGEKLAVSNCKEATVQTTKGVVKFLSDGTRWVSKGKTYRLKKGTEVTLRLSMTREEMEEALTMARRIFPPKGVRYVVNGEEVPYREPFRTLGHVYLPTEKYDPSVVCMRRTWEFTEVELHIPAEGEVACVYEMGIPIQETHDYYHCSVMQKIPMTMERDTVIPSFLRDLRVAVANRMFGELTEETVSMEWVREAMRSGELSANAVQGIADKRWGHKRFVADPGDPRSVDEAKSRGYVQVPAAAMDSREWSAIRRAGAVPSSSSVCPTRIVGHETIDESKWTWQMRLIADYAKYVARIGLDKEIEVRIVHSDATTLAQYSRNGGTSVLSLNRKQLGAKWWEAGVCAETTDLILHELGHEGGQHTERGYHETLTKVAARLAMAIKDKPWKLKSLIECATRGE